MLYLDAMCGPIFIDSLEPALHSVVQLDMLAEAPEVGAAQGDAVLPGLIEHHLHVGENVAGILSGSESVAHGPELLGSLADRLDESEFLHVAGRKGPVKVVDQGYYGLFLHSQLRFSPQIIGFYKLSGFRDKDNIFSHLNFHFR